MKKKEEEKEEREKQGVGGERKNWKRRVNSIQSNIGRK